MHYQRWRKYGDPLGGGTAHAPNGALLKWLNEVALNHADPGACLIWPYSKAGRGYARLNFDGRLQYVSRIICERRHGPPPTDKHEAAHSCGKGHEGCVNQWHLDWKTRAENEADKLEHGTLTRGERSGNSKLSKSAVLEIRRMLDAGLMQREIGDIFGVSNKTISKIATGTLWSWLP